MKKQTSTSGIFNAYKVITVGICTAMVLGLVACGGDSDKPKDETEEPKGEIVEPTEVNVVDTIASVDLETELHPEAQAALEELPPANDRARELYEENCTLCHGIDGTLGKFQAANLKTSTMLLPDKIEIIANGKGMMKAYKGELTDEEIEMIAGYLIYLK